MSDMGNYGNGLPPELLQMLLPYLGGQSNKDASSTLGVQAKGTNNVQDLIKLLFDPQFAMMSGTYDPMLIAGQQAQPYPESTPITDRYMNSGNPAIANVAAGIASGQYDPLTAKQVLLKASEDGSVTGFTPEQLYSAVDDIATEVAKNAQGKAEWDAKQKQSADASSPYAKAGLPSPTDVYTADTMPLDAQHSQLAGGYDKRASDALRQLDQFQANPSNANDPYVKQATAAAGAAAQPAQDPFMQGNNWFEQPQIQQKLAAKDAAAADPKKKDSKKGKALFENIHPRGIPKGEQLAWNAQKAVGQTGFGAGMRQGRAQAATDQGQTPLSDALKQRYAMLRAIGLL